VTTVIVLLAGTTGLAWVWWKRPGERRAAVAIVAASGLGFQAVHALEHLVQIGAWALSPGRTPFLTPWATAGRDALAVGGNVTVGEELLHLSGNLVFLVGLVALAVLVGRSGVGRSRSLQLALAIQGFHVLEHVALTASAAIGGRALGVTTVFGALEPGPLLWTYRPMAHFALNTVATLFALDAVVGFARRRGRWGSGRRPNLVHD
jgi:hypothetical protein